ncbi:MAG: hypothetical protein K9J17_00870 [Flavobacteriales bacterium]|nr:hypothetical protein [Flavobacteriales bacterium]
MNTKFSKWGFLFLLIVSSTGFTSCEKQETATASIEVVEKYTATQGTVTRFRPIDGAELKIYGPTGSSIEAILFTDAEGKTTFTYEYEAYLNCDVSYLGRVSEGNPVKFELGKTTSTTIILPE